MSDFQPMIDSLMEGEEDALLALVRDALGRGVAAGEILDRGLIAAMEIVGDQMERQEIFIPQVLMAARTMGAALDVLKPHLAAEGVRSKGKLVIGTVKGDLHDIGKNLVAMVCESAGFEVGNLGVDVAPERFLDEAETRGADVVMLSALLTTTMPMMKKTIDLARERGLREKVKILVGGAPVSQAYADEIGADGYASDATSAAKMVKALLA
jgi:5-methyltetrahydrofolate--homocysteine methyltransferase